MSETAIHQPEDIFEAYRDARRQIALLEARVAELEETFPDDSCPDCGYSGMSGSCPCHCISCDLGHGEECISGICTHAKKEAPYKEKADSWEDPR